MDVALNKHSDVDLVSKLREVTAMCRISRLGDMMYEFFDNLSEDNPINYVGELNKNDIMH
jgi:hypothetical protein